MTLKTSEAPATRRAWAGALACFVLAGATGAFFRFGMAHGFTGGLSLANVRHAHSHLMYFGWVTPALAALMLQRLPRLTGRPLPRWASYVPALMLATGLLAYPLFLAYGYAPAEIGTRRLPLSVISAGLNVLGWYLFVGLYARHTKGVPRSRPLLLWDIALIFLVAATMGAWGLALMKPLGVESVFWPSALTHLFLDLFSEGWFVLAVLGLAVRPGGGTERGDWSLWALVAGLPVMFVFGMPPSLVPPALAGLARAGGLLVAVGLAVQGARIMRTAPRAWRLPLLMLGLKVSMLATFSVLPQDWWAGHHGLRILYLHVTLLGFVTLGLAAAGPVRRGQGLLAVAVLAVLATIVPLTAVWPWGGTWRLTAAAWATVLPVLTGAGLLVDALRRE